MKEKKRKYMSVVFPRFFFERFFLKTSQKLFSGDFFAWQFFLSTFRFYVPFFKGFCFKGLFLLTDFSKGFFSGAVFYTCFLRATGFFSDLFLPRNFVSKYLFLPGNFYKRTYSQDLFQIKILQNEFFLFYTERKIQ